MASELVEQAICEAEDPGGCSGRPSKCVQRESGSKCAYHDAARAAIAATPLGEIARGRPDNGRPLSGHKARQIARDALTQAGLDW